jgi:pimeloyl-ACP methyl ester carboxylesterase
MPTLTTTDGVNLYYEEVGHGAPLIFVHEFAGDHRSFELQMRYFARLYRCIAYAERGYPPSDVPADMAAYSQARAVDDIRDVMDALGIARAHVCGVSMGGSSALHFAMTYPDRCLSMVLAGVGSGSVPDRVEGFRVEAEHTARAIEKQGMAAMAPQIAAGGARVAFEVKDPRGYAEFRAQLAEHSALGSAHTLRGVQKGRASIYEERAAIAACDVPALIIVGDEDEPCLEPSLMLKRTLPRSGLAMLAKTGHAINIEEPAAFNAAVQDFLHRVEAGRWDQRDPRATAQWILGDK